MVFWPRPIGRRGSADILPCPDHCRRLENQAMNEYQVTFTTGEVVEVEAWTPEIARAIAEEEAGLDGHVRRQRRVATPTADRRVAQHGLVNPRHGGGNPIRAWPARPHQLHPDDADAGRLFRRLEIPLRGGYAILRAGANTIEFYDEQGTC